MAKSKLVEITTESGFTWKIDPEIGNDMEVIDEFTAIITGTANFVPADFVIRLIGEDGKKALYEYHRDKKTGRVYADKIGPDLADIMNKAAEVSKK